MEFLQEAVATSLRGGTEISLIGPKELHAPIRRDAFRRCLMNLIGNADRYGGHVWLTVMPAQTGVEDDDRTMTVPAFPKHCARRCSGRSSAWKAPRNQATGGIGLGLTIARDIMLSHGGELKLETSPQGGVARAADPAAVKPLKQAVRRSALPGWVRTQHDGAGLVREAQDQHLGHEFADLARREIDHGRDLAADQGLDLIMHRNLGRGFFGADLRPEVDGQLDRRLARLGIRLGRPRSCRPGYRPA